MPDALRASADPRRELTVAELDGRIVGTADLTIGKHRAQAHALYRSVGLEAVAEGFKIYFDE